MYNMLCLLHHLRIHHPPHFSNPFHQLTDAHNVMDLPELQSDKLLLGLDLVAGWQIEQIQSQAIYKHWTMSEMPFTGAFEPCNPVIAGEDSSRTLGLALSEDGKIHFVNQINWFDGGFHLLVWALSERFEAEMLSCDLPHHRGHFLVDCRKSLLECVSHRIFFVGTISLTYCLLLCQSFAGDAMLPELTQSHFSHLHLRKERFWTPFNDKASEAETNRPSTHDVSKVKLPSPSESTFTTILPTPYSDEGKRACQQILEDMQAWWQGKPVRYLAMYTRNW